MSDAQTQVEKPSVCPLDCPDTCSLQVTVEDNRTTSELRDRYIIESSLDLSIASVKQRFGDQVKELQGDFAYNSDNNENWMHSAEIRASLIKLGMMPKS